MIISKSHKFIFLHVPKTGGKSVYQTLGDISTREHGPHTSIQTAREFVGKGQFRKYFKFSFVRNPWDRMVSMYKYSRHRGTFKEFVKSRITEPSRKFCQNMWVVENGKLAVDFLGMYERLQEDFNLVCNKIGIEDRILKEVGRSKRGPYQDYYDGETRSLVAEFFKDNIEIFGYIYES